MSQFCILADDDDAEDAARPGKKSHVHPSWRTDASPGHGQSTRGAEASCVTAGQHACDDQPSRPRRHTTIT